MMAEDAAARAAVVASEGEREGGLALVARTHTPEEQRESTKAS
jgi:hypothetical protein